MHDQRGQLKQLPGVGDTMSGRLEANGIITLTDLGCATSVKVDAITGRKHPFGNGKVGGDSLLVLTAGPLRCQTIESTPVEREESYDVG